MSNFCEKIKIPEKEIAEGFHSKVSLIHLKNGKKMVVKDFRDSVILKDKKRENIDDTLRKQVFIKKAGIPVLDLYYSHDKIYSDFLNINNKVAVSNNINLEEGIVYFDENNSKKVFKEKIHISDFNKILDQLVDIF